MQKEKKNAARKAILIAAAEKLINLNFSIDMEELQYKASRLFEDFMLTEYSNDLEQRTNAYEVLSAVRDFNDLMAHINHKLEQIG